MSNNRELADLISQAGGTSEGVLAGRRNLIINGAMQVWQRGTSFTSSEFCSDRWYSQHSGSTKTVSQQSFTVGQTEVNNNPSYYIRTVVSSSAGASNFVNLQQKIEDVTRFSGETVTLSFWAKADSAKEIATEFRQIFGTGGSALVSTGATTYSLTTNWQRFTHTVTLPSISGKTIGSGSNFRVAFWFDAGSDFDALTASLGQQSGTFDIANVQLELGSVATPFEHRSYGEELALCQRYYQEQMVYSLHASGENDHVGGLIPLAGTMRSQPSTTIYDLTGTAGKVSYANTGNVGGPTAGGSIDGVSNSNSVLGQINALFWWKYVNNNNTYGFVSFRVVADAEL